LPRIARRTRQRGRMSGSATDLPRRKRSGVRVNHDGFCIVVREWVIEVGLEGTDQYGRILGRVFLGSDDINVAMVRAGMAWQYRYSRDKSIEAAQAEARTARRGLWADANPVDPWEWRATRKRGRSDSAAERP
jgi:endonuclease YncB( thermonuclease family)